MNGTGTLARGMVRDATGQRLQRPATRRAAAGAASTRVMQVVLSLAPGGTEHLVVEMCRRLPSDVDVTVCCLDQEGDWAAQVKALGIDVIALHRPPGFRPSVGRQLARIASERRISLLHCHQYSPFVYGRMARLWNPGLKLVYTEHGRLSDAPPPLKRRLVNPVLSRGGGAILAVSEDLRRYMLDAGFPGGRVGVIRNGIDAGAAPSAAGRADARRLLGVGAGAFVAATVARLDPVKDLHTMLEGFAIVRRSAPNARLVIVGDGPERGSLSERATAADLAGAVEFLGYRSDVREILAAADLYLNTSISEGISLTVLEAMAAGVPVVATAAGGTPEVLADGDSGILVPVRDPLRLAGAITALIGDGPRRATLAIAARRRLESLFTIERMVTEYARLYQRLLAN